MKKMIAVLLLAIMLTGCGWTTVEETSTKTASRFIKLEETSKWIVVADKETGVMYSVSDGGYSHGIFTLLVDENGNPLIWDGEGYE